MAPGYGCRHKLWHMWFLTPSTNYDSLDYWCSGPKSSEPQEEESIVGSNESMDGNKNKCFHSQAKQSIFNPSTWVFNYLKLHLLMYLHEQWVKCLCVMWCLWWWKDNYHTPLQFLSSLWNILVSFSLLFWFLRPSVVLFLLTFCCCSEQLLSATKNPPQHQVTN